VPPEQLPCSQCPIRDLGIVYPVKDPRDPWRRMPRLMAQLVATFGPLMYNRRSRTRIDVEERISTYCERVRHVHGQRCNRERQRLCCSVLHTTVYRASRSDAPYPLLRAGLSSMLSSDVLYAQLQRTRDNEPIDLDLVLREIDHVT
jgi:hypothetical protein